MLAALQSWWSSTWPQLIALLVALVAAWIAYRLQRGEEGEGVLAALVAELELPGISERGLDRRLLREMVG